MPHLRNPHFTGRDALLDALHAKLTSGRVALTAVRGMGGVGKTQLALEYAYRHAAEFDLVWWLRAEEAATLLGDYAALAEPLGLPQAGEREVAAVAQAVCLELARRERWLLVFDNATEPKDLEPLLPRGGGGRVLITSRNPNWPLAQPLDVPVLARPAAVALLLERTGQGDEAAAKALAEELGDLPLALEQAAAYMAETGLALADYLALFRTRRRELWAEEKPPQGRSDTVGTTWTIALEQLRAEEPAAVSLLNLCAFLAPEAIPRKLLVEHHDALPPELGEAVPDPLRLNRLVGALRRYSLVEVTGEGLSFHRLVQAATRDDLISEEPRRWAGAAVALMEAGFPYKENDPATWATSRELLAHTLAAAGHAEPLAERMEAVGHLLNQAGNYLETIAEFEQAQACYERALRAWEAGLGPDHPSVATAINNLGLVLRRQGDLGAARACYERALEIDEVTYGPDHPEVARDVNNLGLVLQARGELAAARAAFERALRINEAAYGPDHPRVATNVNNLGDVLRELGELAGARAALERALGINEAAYGPDHPEVATDVNKLGGVLRELGELAGARAACERALTIFERFFPADHPRVVTVRNNLRELREEADRGST